MRGAPFSKCTSWYGNVTSVPCVITTLLTSTCNTRKVSSHTTMTESQLLCGRQLWLTIWSRPGRLSSSRSRPGVPSIVTWYPRPTLPMCIS